MTQQTDRTWQYGQTAATLLVAYMFVLQGLAVGLAFGAQSARGGYGNAICLSARSTPASGKPAGPSRASHGLDACCVQHCSGLDDGVVAGFVEPPSPVAAHATLLTPLSDSGYVRRRATLPVGARAPPSAA
ncbi:MAG: hypothetical protein C3F11_16610 [Methylocystaceae bacterium]|nr:MAG: hypothetical protein C3F11_16610 [Methylocystaceae bacterium]